jgi:hypothetical protein
LHESVFRLEKERSSVAYRKVRLRVSGKATSLRNRGHNRISASEKPQTWLLCGILFNPGACASMAKKIRLSHAVGEPDWPAGNQTLPIMIGRVLEFIVLE